MPGMEVGQSGDRGMPHLRLTGPATSDSPMHETRYLNKLHGRAVIIGLNPAGDGQPPLRIPAREWTNFHWPGTHNRPLPCHGVLRNVALGVLR